MQFDVAIIGASNAGLYAAERLANAGRRVLVAERRDKLSHARRTYIVTPKFRQLLGYVPDGACLHRIHKMRVATPNAATDIHLQDPDLIVERNALIQHLAARARAAGVHMRYNHRFLDLAPHPQGATVQFTNEKRQKVAVTAGAVIGADGVSSAVATAAGIPRVPSVPILQAEVKLPPGWDPALTQVWFDVDETRFFYWLIPESDTRAVVGLIGDDGTQNRHLLHNFLKKLKLQPQAYQAAQVAMHKPGLKPWTRVGSARVLLVGDAAGQVKVTTVGGTVSGIWAAQAAVDALLKNKSYARALRPLKRELDLHWYMRLLLERMSNEEYDYMVQTLSEAAQDFLGRYNRDQMARTIWRLPLRQPRLILLGLRLLLNRRRSKSKLPASVPAASD